MGTDATRCAVCGGEFTAQRVWIEGRQYHPSCSVMSYPPHRPEDYARISELLWRLCVAAERFDEDLSENCDGPPRDALRHAIAGVRALTAPQ